MQQKQKRINELPLNKFHQLNRKKKQENTEISCATLKKQARDLQRLLDHGKLTDEVKLIKQQEFDEKNIELKHKQWEVKQRTKAITYFTKKYARVKSFELKKLNKKLKRLVATLETADPATREQLKLDEVDILDKISYVKNYPKDKKYISLFGKSTCERALEQQQGIYNEIKHKSAKKEFMKYRVVTQEVKQVDDDFLMDCEGEQTNKQMVDKQGKEYVRDFKIPILSQQTTTTHNLEPFHKLYPGLATTAQMDELALQTNNPSRTKILLQSLLQENGQLKEELQIQSGDLVHFTTIVDQLIHENRSLAELLNKKDIELYSLLETATINEAEDITDYKHQLQLMEDENSILIKHVQEFKLENAKLTQQNKTLEKQYQQGKLFSNKLEQELEISKVREETVVRELNVLKQQYDGILDSKNDLEGETMQSEYTINQQHQQIKDLTDQIEHLENQLDCTIEEKNQKIAQQSSKIYELSVKIDDLCHELERSQIYNESNQRERQEYSEQNAELQEVCDRIAEQNDDLTNKLIIENQRLVVYQQHDIQLREQLIQLENSMSQQQLTVHEQEREIRKLIQQNQQDLEEQKYKYDTHIARLKTEYSDALKEKDDEYQRLEEGKNKEDTQLEELTIDNQKLQQEILHVKQEMHDYGQLRKIIEQQQLQLRQAKMQSKEDKQLIQEIMGHKNNVSSDLDERDKKIMEIIQTKDQRLNEMERENQLLLEQCNFLEEHRRNGEELERLTYTYKQQKEILEQEMHGLKQETENLKIQLAQAGKDLKLAKQKQDQALVEENKQLRQENNELSKLREIQVNQLVGKQPSETSGSRIKPPTPGGSRALPPAPQNLRQQSDFMATQPKQAYYQQPIASPQQSRSPPMSRSPSVGRPVVEYSQDHDDSQNNLNNLMDSSASSNDSDKKLQFSFAQLQQQQQQQQYQQQQQQYHQQQQANNPYQRQAQQFQGRRNERESSYGSSMSNRPYLRKPQ